MGNRMKDDERIERAIRSLMKLPENRRCINCNALGPQYVCITFFTFVCTNCSGIHREFTHRVKSVSMAKFTAEELNSLQAGGNERARQMYTREWDLQRHPFPDGSNLHKLREFIKHVYVDRKYTGERSNTGLPRLTLSGKAEDSEIRKSIARRGVSRSSFDDGKYKRYPAERSSSFGEEDMRINSFYDEIRSPRSSRMNMRNVAHKKRFEIVDDRFRDDRFGGRRFSLADTVSQRKQPNSNNANADKPSSPVVRPLQEILGENFPTLRVGEISKENNAEHADRTAHNQESTDPKPLERKTEIPQSLIDFDIDTPDASVTSQTQQSPFSIGNSWASAGSSEKQGSSQAPKMQTLESLLFDLSVPSTTDEHGSNVATGVAALTQQTPQLLDGNVIIPKQPSNDNLLQASGSNDIPVEAISDRIQQPQPSPAVAAENSSFPQMAPVSTNNVAYLQPNISSFSHNGLGSSSFSVQPPSQYISGPVQNTFTEVESQFLPGETKSSRNEIPADMFTINTSYLSLAPPPLSGWQTASNNGMGFNYYPNIMPVPAFQNPGRSINPFDIHDEGSQFPSVASLQGALPNASTGFLHADTSGIRTYPLQMNLNDFHRLQGLGGLGSDGAVFGSTNTTQQPNATYSAPATPNPSSIEGNPFA